MVTVCQTLQNKESGTKKGHAGTNSSVNISSHVTRFQERNRSDINFANPRAHDMGSNIEGGVSTSVAGEVLRFFGINDWILMDRIKLFDVFKES